MVRFGNSEQDELLRRSLLNSRIGHLLSEMSIEELEAVYYELSTRVSRADSEQ